MYALIYEGDIVDIAANEFEVHPSMTWVTCPNDCTLATHEYVDGEVREKVIEPEPVVVPQSVSRYKAIAQLYQAGLLPQVNAMMADHATDPLVVIAWNNAQEFRRDSPMILAIAPALGLTGENIDQLFIAASQIE